MCLIRRHKLFGMHGFSLLIRAEWGGFVPGCGFSSQTNSISVMANVRFRVRLVARKIAGKCGNLFFITFFFEITKFSRIKSSYQDTMQPEI